jgi:phosphatidylserine synthase
MMRPSLPRPDVRRVVVLFPSGLTLGNLFFGIFAIVAASRQQFTQAGWYIVLGGICDAFDGRVARATNSEGRFGEELDSLVDAITFGLAPAMMAGTGSGASSSRRAPCCVSRASTSRRRERRRPSFRDFPAPRRD